MHTAARQFMIDSSGMRILRVLKNVWSSTSVEELSSEHGNPTDPYTVAVLSITVTVGHVL